MCVVSNIGDYYKDRFPIIPRPWTNQEVWPYPPYPLPEPEKNTKPSKPRDPTPEEIEDWIKKNQNWTIDKYKEFKKLLDAARKLDALMGDKDCEDPLKVQWINELEVLIKELKKRVKVKKAKK